MIHYQQSVSIIDNVSAIEMYVGFRNCVATKLCINAISLWFFPTNIMERVCVYGRID